MNFDLQLERMKQLHAILATSTEEEVTAMTNRPRTEEDILSTLRAINADTLATNPRTASSEEAMDTTEVSTSYHESTSTTLPGGPSSVTLSSSWSWTNETHDDEFIDHLLSLYFTWDWPFYQPFPMDLFLADFKSGRTRFCSRSLVNAILGVGCQFSDRFQARDDPKDSKTAGHQFFREARSSLMREPTSSCTAIAAMNLFAFAGNFDNCMDTAWNWLGQASRMALQLNLHLKPQELPFTDLSEDATKEYRYRSHVFWGAFHMDP